MNYIKLATFVIAASLVLSACGAGKSNNASGIQPTASVSPIASVKPAATETPKELKLSATTDVKSYKDLKDEFTKGTAEGAKVDYDKVEKLYNEQFKSFVQARDPEVTQVQIASIIKAGKDGSLKADVVKQLIDKLGQKVVFLAIRNDFKELEANFDDKNKAKSVLEDAKVYYSVLKVTVEKRDTAYQTQLVTAIDGALNDISKAIESGKKLDFLLAKQVTDKTLMKTFYLASGGSKGYAYKIENAVKEGKEPKVEQAEGWGFYQSLYSYLVKSAKEDAEYLQKAFDLTTNPKDIKGDVINQAYVRAFAAVAKSEYKESAENWGKDKSVVTALEGALFIQVIDEDAKKYLGEVDTKTLIQKSGQLVEAVKANDKTKADTLYKDVDSFLEKLVKVGK